jgi:hypothetical protein
MKTGESLSSVRIDPPLKSSAGWEGWMVAAEAALTLAYGSKGVPLSYIIRENEAPQPAGHATWELKAIHAAPLTGLDYEADRMTVHLFILIMLVKNRTHTPTSNHCFDATTVDAMSLH